MANGHGGRRPGAGRKPGSANLKTRDIANRAFAEGLTPLEYMLGVLRDEMADPVERRWAATNAAPYVHPRLATTAMAVVNDTESPLAALARELSGTPLRPREPQEED